MLCVTEMPGWDTGELYRLWPRKQIEAGYRRAIGALQKSTRRLQGMDRRDAARETFLVGEAVIRRINADPLLPDEMIDADLRRQMIGDMVRYNRLGRSVWGDFYQQSHAAASAT
jgi:phenylacetic acid degradation operon negative regulatory protein